MESTIRNFNFTPDMSNNINTFVPDRKDQMGKIARNLEEKELLIDSIITIESSLERAIVSDKEFREGLFFGKPRYGHPEGEVIFHIKEVFQNVEKYSDGPFRHLREKLRIITLVHDTFKFKEHASRLKIGRTPENHHAVFAANFFDKYSSDQSLRNLILLHDEAYYCWQLFKMQKHVECQMKLNRLLEVLGKDLQLFYLFFKCDTETGDKNQEPIKWFEQTIEGIVVV